MASRQPRKRTRRLKPGDATDLYTRPGPRSAPPTSVVVNRAFVGQDVWHHGTQVTLKQPSTRRSHYLVLALGLVGMLLLDGAAFTRIVGWWGPTQMIPTGGVPGIFVPMTLRALAAGGPDSEWSSIPLTPATNSDTPANMPATGPAVSSVPALRVNHAAPPSRHGRATRLVSHAGRWVRR